MSPYKLGFKRTDFYLFLMSLLVPRDRAAVWVEESGSPAAPRRHSALSWSRTSWCTHGSGKLVVQVIFFSTLTTVSLFHSKSQVPSCVF